ncbi:MAG: transporter substrate-binding domain-containing protein, partial [Clostridia bacterium]|nr:transporter substrate-binding domain-containing protein [Clostridia bacterium]
YTVYEPMNYTDEAGNFTGFDTEFAQKVCEKLGVEPEFVEIVWDMKVVELNSKAIDCIWNGMTINDDLKAQIAISDPYVKNMQVIVINKKNAATYVDTLSLADKDIVVEAGSAGESVVAEDENLKNANAIQVTKQIDALLEVKAGTADAAVLDWTLAKSMIGEGTDYEDLMIVEGVELSVEEYGIGFRAGSDLCTEVNTIMAELIADGTLPALAEKYGLSLAE